MKIHNIIFRAFLIIVLLGATQVEAKEMLVVKSEVGNEKNKEYKKVNFPLIIEDFKTKQLVAKVDKCFGDDDDKKLLVKIANKKTNILNVQQESFNINIAEIHKPQLFLLYSSLKVDC